MNRRLKQSEIRSRQEHGKEGEERVAAWLRSRGYRILARNARVGRLEIDIVAFRDGTLVFCEVRTRRKGSIVSAIESVGPTKIRNLRRAASGWLASHPIRAKAIRFDVAAVEIDGARMLLDYYDDAFR